MPRGKACSPAKKRKKGRKGATSPGGRRNYYFRNAARGKTGCLLATKRKEKNFVKKAAVPLNHQKERGGLSGGGRNGGFKTTPKGNLLYLRKRTVGKDYFVRKKGGKRILLTFQGKKKVTCRRSKEKGSSSKRKQQREGGKMFSKIDKGGLIHEGWKTEHGSRKKRRCEGGNHY